MGNISKYRDMTSIDLYTDKWYTNLSLNTLVGKDGVTV